jgi:putative NADH-flavin reductase
MDPMKKTVFLWLHNEEGLLMKIALIGATGNVGSRLLAELLRRGYEVAGVVRHGENRISMEDFAIAFADEIESPRHPRQRFTVGY